MSLLLTLFTYRALFGELKLQDLKATPDKNQKNTSKIKEFSEDNCENPGANIQSNQGVGSEPGTSEGISQDSTDFDVAKVTLFVDRLKAILSLLLTPESKDNFLNSASEHVVQESNYPIHLPTCTHLPFQGKLKYFDADMKLKLSDKGAKQLKKVFEDVKIETNQDIHCINESNPLKSASLSSRRVAIVASLLNSLGYLLGYGLLSGEDDGLFGTDVDATSISGIESSSSILIGMLFSLIAVTEVLKYDKQHRIYDLVMRYRIASVKALLSIQRQPKKNQSLPSEVSTANLSSERDDAKETDALLENTTSKVSSLFPMDEKEFKKAFSDLNNLWSVEDLKGIISAEFGRIRSYYTLAGNVAVGVVAAGATLSLLFLDCATLSATFWVRLGPALGAVALIVCVRYWVKEQQNMRKLYAKYYREQLNKTFQAQLLAELTVYGLQPVKVDGSIPTVSSTHVDIKRKVEVDVENFLNKELAVKIVNNVLTIDKDGEKQFICNINPRKLALKALSVYVHRNLPKKYRAHPKYFVEEFLFQVRVKFPDENKEIIRAQREASFSRPAAEFAVKKDTKSIRKLNQYMMAHTAQDAPSHDEVLKHLHNDLRWNPRIALLKKSSSTRRNDSEKLKKQVKKELLYTFGYQYYAATHFRAMPWRYDQKILSAYYVKRYESARVACMAKTETRDSRFHYSSSRLFKELIDEKQPKHTAPISMDKPDQAEKEQTAATDKAPSKSLKQQHQDNMAGVFAASVIASTGMGLAIIYPILGYAANVTLNIPAQLSVYFSTSLMSKYGAIQYRRMAKKELKLVLPSPSP